MRNLQRGWSEWNIPFQNRSRKIPNFWKLHCSWHVCPCSLFQPGAISAASLSCLAEAITAACCSDGMLLLEAMKCEERDSGGSNNRLSQPRQSEFLAVGCLTIPTLLPTHSTPWLMQIGIKRDSAFSQTQKYLCSHYSGWMCVFKWPFSVRRVFSCASTVKTLQPVEWNMIKSRKKKVGKKNVQTSLMHLHWFCFICSLPQSTQREHTRLSHLAGIKSHWD